jgi:hypothetical protein
MPEKHSSNRLNLHNIIFLVVLLGFLLPGCAGGGGGSPTVPALSDTEGSREVPQLTAAVNYPANDPSKSHYQAVWGVWDVTIDRETGLRVVPVRDAQYALNVVEFLQPPMGSLSNLSVTIIDREKLFIAGDVTVDVSLTHPFPSLTQFTGFDVMGVFIGTGDYIANSDAKIHYSNPERNPILRNADGYTRWMNPMEFTTPGIVGYTEGALGNKNQFWNSSLNPYKYFANGLHSTQSIIDFYSNSINVANRGMFTTTATNTRRYVLDFPMIDGRPDVRFQYAVVANWAEPASIPPMMVPEDFPAEANMQEAFNVTISTVGSTIYWNNMYDNGGDLFLTLEIFDWQGMTNSTGVAGEIKRIILDSPDEFINGGTKLVFNQGDWVELPAECPNSAKLALDVGPVDPGGPCPYDNDVLITIVTAELGDYDNGLGGAYPTDGILSGYARLFYDLGNVCNDPPTVWFINCPDNPLEVGNRTFVWDGEDDVTPNDELQYRWKLDEGAWSDWETNLKYANLENMTEEEHRLYVECRDMDGQVSETTCEFSIELPAEPQPPTVNFTNCNQYIRTTSYTFNLAISDDRTNLAHIKVRYQYDGGGWVNLPDGTTSIHLTGFVSGGPHQLLVEVEDLDGMIGQALCEFDVNFAPDVTIDNCPSQDVNTSSYNFTWTGTDPELDPLEYQTRTDGGAWSTWGPGTSLNVTGLGSGNHSIYVRARDITGGTDQTYCNYKVNFAPSITITNPPSQDVNGNSYTFNWTASDDLDSPLTMDYNVELDGVWQGWQTGITSYQWTPLSSGPHTFKVRVRDTGNPGLTDEDVCNFLVNRKPSVTIDNCPSGIWASSDITFNWTGTDDNSPPAGMSYAYKMDSDPWSAWQLGLMTMNFTGLADGDHTFAVRVRDTGNPQLTCDTPPNTCDSCDFTIDQSCAYPPTDVQNFQATDADPSLNNREVLLTWDGIPNCVNWYDIERYEYDWVNGWEWVPLVTVDHPDTSYLDTDARYSGPTNAIEYRIKARNAAGSSPNWVTDTGYPLPRYVHMALWCTADDAMGNGASTTWARAAADFLDCNDFWNDYGIEFVARNTGNFFWIPDPSLKDLTGFEDRIMHQTYGQTVYPDTINVYFVTSSNGNTSRGYCMCYCPGSNHNTYNVYIVLCRDTRGSPPNENHIVLAHENGHGVSRYFDEYLLDTNRDLIQDSTCAVEDTWCTVPPNTPWLFCDDNGCYPENPGASGKVPKQLMWYSFVGATIDQYDVLDTQYIWTDEWIHGHESNYPWP